MDGTYAKKTTAPNTEYLGSQNIIFILALQLSPLLQRGYYQD